MQEIWKDIPGYEGKYQVSSLGNVKSLNYNHTSKEKLIKTSSSKGYLTVVLYKDNKAITKKVHRLVGEVFIPNPDNLPYLNHKNEQKDDNRVENLEWCDSKYNNTYGTRLQRVSEAQKGFKNHSSKKVRCIETGEIFDCASDASRAFNLDRCAVAVCCRGNGRRKTVGGYHWEYLS